MGKLDRLEKRGSFFLQFAEKVKMKKGSISVCHHYNGRVYKRYSDIRDRLKEDDEFKCRFCLSQETDTTEKRPEVITSHKF